MAVAATYNFKKMKRGDVFKARRLKMWSDAANTVPIDCTGIRILMQVRKSKFDPVVLEWSTDDDTIVVENTNEVVLQKRTKQEMDIEGFQYNYDIEFEFDADEPETLIEGIFPISNDISKKWI